MNLPLLIGHLPRQDFVWLEVWLAGAGSLYIGRHDRKGQSGMGDGQEIQAIVEFMIANGGRVVFNRFIAL